jgi:hypothetical protein
LNRSVTLRAIAVVSILLFRTAPACAANAAPAPSPAAVALTDSAFAHQDWARAAKGYAAIVQADPKSVRGWYRLATAEFSLGHFDRAAAAWRGAEAAGLPGRIALYNLACACARGGRPDSALAALQRLMDTGYRQTAQLEADADLASVRGDARFAAVLERSRHNEKPCAYQPESRQFDFWIGDWDVTDNLHANGAAGTSHVELILGDCVVFENWSGRQGGHGKSFNAWDASTKRWQQNWMDDSGTVTNYVDGRFEDDHLRFTAEKHAGAPEGRVDRLTFFRLGPDRVRQVFDHSTDGGATWVADIDLDYARHH